MDSTLDLLFFIVFILCGIIVGSLATLPSRIIVTVAFIGVSFVIGSPIFGLMFFVGMLVASLVLDFINSAQGGKRKKEIISI
jgi:hypothetical protein